MTPSNLNDPANIFNRHERELAFVPRWTIVRTIRKQSVAEHSFYVALWADRIAELMGIHDPEFRHALGRYALVHDMAEIYTGDTPSPFKSHLNRDEVNIVEWLVSTRLFLGIDDYFLFVVDHALKQIVKTADFIEALVFLYEEQQMGNKSLDNVVAQIENRLLVAWMDLPWDTNSRAKETWLSVGSQLKRIHKEELSKTVDI